MGGKLYYTFDPQKDVRFFALESTYPEPEQIAWFEKEVKASDAASGRSRSSTIRCIPPANATDPI